MRGRAAALLLACGWAGAASAHDNTFSSSRIEVGERTLEMDLRIRNADLAFALEGIDADRDAALTVAEMERGRAALERYLLTKCAAVLDGVPCRGSLLSLEAIPEEEEAAHAHPADTRLRLRYALPHRPGKLSLRIRLYDENDPFHQHLARVAYLGRHPVALLFGRNSVHTLGEAAPPPPVSGFLVQGVVHILTGWDHLLFLAALILGIEGFGRLAGAVTGFTLGHSVTLALAGLGLCTLPERLTESLIALSIALVGFENTRADPLRRRWLLAGAFGLIHGFGFASLLTGRLPQELLLPALLGFNLGIEAGQLALVALAWPLLRRLPAGGRSALSWTVAAAGAALFLARTSGLQV